MSVAIVYPFVESTDAPNFRSGKRCAQIHRRMGFPRLGEGLSLNGFRAKSGRLAVMQPMLVQLHAATKLLQRNEYYGGERRARQIQRLCQKPRDGFRQDSWPTVRDYLYVTAMELSIRAFDGRQMNCSVVPEALWLPTKFAPCC